MVAWSKNLNSSTIFAQAPTPDEKLAAREYQIGLYVSSLHLGFIKASPKGERAVSCYKVDQPIASLPSFCNVHLLQTALTEREN